MPYNERLMKARSWIFGVGIVAIAAAILWRTIAR
jgi:hypothetical protein